MQAMAKKEDNSAAWENNSSHRKLQEEFSPFKHVREKEHQD